MKILIAILVIVTVALNIAVLWPKAEDKDVTALELPEVELTELKPGILPGLIKF